ncbi:MAG: aminotransferase class I/II-fold pyridoxal phosphate-dependent enzyme [Saprospiraceae bacterium]|nr:aminotransferase class I/II-fold pyridoxal phosphate-dependent enzyme [Saprospiraceae bacterium]
MSKRNLSFQSLCVKEHKDTKTTTPHQLPVYATSSFVFDEVEESVEIFTGKKQGHVYSRYGNPTIDTVAAKVAGLEALDTQLEPFAFMTSSGMSAISTLCYAICDSGDSILTQANIYGGTTELFNKVMLRHGINPIYTRHTDTDTLRSIVSENPAIKAIYLETPSNPMLDCVDLEAISAFAKEKGLITIIDNTFCTPYLQQPLKFGIDFIIHSATKYLNGHGNSISGIIIGTDDDAKVKIKTTLKLMGGTCNAWDAWLLNNGLKTLTLRMDVHSRNAMELAQWLSLHPAVEQVNYCGLESHASHIIAKKQMSAFGGMLSFKIKGGQQDAFRFMNKLQLCTQAPTLGDVDTLVLHPATSSHLNIDKEIRESFGITQNLIRVSVGIENIADIVEYFGQVFE